jgi:hypothetical protein
MEYMKKPTLREKVDQYEKFLHKINSFIVCCENEGIVELVENADNWSYAHRVSNGELSEKEQQKIIDNSFWKLLDTPRADAKIKERQEKWKKANENKSKKSS